MEERLSKVSCWFSVTAAAILISAGTFVFCATNAKAANIGFGITTKKTKIGTANSELYGGGYHNIAVDGNDVYVAYGDQSDTGEHLVCLGTSHDGGLTWAGPAIIAHGQITTRTISIAVARSHSKKVIHVAWNMGNILLYANSSTGWTPVNVNGATHNTGYGQSMVVDRSGTVHIAFHDYSKLNYTKSSGNYANFDKPTTISDTIGGEPSIWVDGQDNVCAAWINGCKGGIYFSKLIGAGWSPPVQVTSKVACNGVSMVAKDGNNIYIGWAYQEGVYVIGSSDGGSTWPQAPHTVTTPGGGRAASLVLAFDGALNIAWGTNTGVYFSSSANNGTTWSNPTFVMETEGFPHIAVDSVGKVYITDYVWMSGTQGTVYFTKGK